MDSEDIKVQTTRTVGFIANSPVVTNNEFVVVQGALDRELRQNEKNLFKEIYDEVEIFVNVVGGFWPGGWDRSSEPA